MSLQALLKLVTDTLNVARVPYMLTGSLAGSFHGAPRATQDIDLVVEAGVEDLLAVADALRTSGLYVSDEAIREASATGGMFNAIDPETGWKIDFILRKDRPFSRAELEAREEIDFMGVTVNVAAAEDLVVAKLEWAQLADSERQLRDVVDILGVQGARLDIRRIETWVDQLGLRSQWARVQRRLEPDG